MRTKLIRSKILLLMLPAALGFAQQKGLQESDTKPVSTEQRVALVIGNNAYKVGPLINPVNDARDMAKALEALGFKVILRENASYVDMRRAVQEFGKNLNNNSVGLFYYSGHGMQVSGENYLIPVDAEIYNEDEAAYVTVNADFVLAQMKAARNRLNIIILDACRNNPFTRSFRSQSVGLASMIAPTGSLIAYATSPGSVASDGTGKNGLYTGELLAQMKVPGQKLEEMFKKVRINVVDRSKSQQVPWELSSVMGDFYFTTAKVEEPVVTAYDDAVPIERNADVTWWSDGSLYWLNVRGDQVQNETVSGYAGDDLLVYHASSNKTYLLDAFKKNGDNQHRSAGILKSSETAFWRGNKGLYWLVINGGSIQLDVKSAWAGDDLLAYHPKTRTTYVMKDFDAKSDNKIRTAEVLRSNYNAYWKASKNLFWLVVNGSGIQNTVEQTFSGNDLITYDSTSNATYVLMNYVNRQDNQLRPADVFASPCQAVWRASGNFYWLYVNGVAVQSESTSEYEGDDLIVEHTPTTKKYRLRNFKDHGDNLLREAECVY